MPSNTHNRLVHLICRDSPVDVQLHNRLIKFILGCKNSKNMNVKMCAALVLDGRKSCVGSSWNFIKNKYDNLSETYSFNNDESEDNLVKAGAIRDFLCLKNDINDEHLQDIISILCTE